MVPPPIELRGNAENGDMWLVRMVIDVEVILQCPFYKIADRGRECGNWCPHFRVKERRGTDGLQEVTLGCGTLSPFVINFKEVDT